MSIRKSSLCALLLVLTTLPARAQVPQRVSFDDAVRIALDQSLTLQQQINQVRLQEVGVRNARAAFLPSFNMSTSAGRSFGLSFDTNVGERRTTANDRFNLSASSGITVFDGMRSFRAVDQSRLELAATDFGLDRLRQDVVFTVAGQFLTYIQQYEQIGVQQENLTAAEQLLAQIEEFVRVGSRPVSDQYQQSAAVASAELALLEAERLAQVAEASLIQTLKLDPLGVYEFVVPDVDQIPLVPGDYDVNELLGEAMARRSDLRAQEAAIQATEVAVRSARGGMLPTVSLSASAGTSFNSGSPFVFGDQLDNNRSESIGLSVNFPVFNRLRTRSQSQQAQIQHENERIRLEVLQQQIGLEVRQAYLEYLTAEKRLDVTQEQLTFREQTLEAERERYRVGAATLVELTQAQSQFVQAQSDAVTARYTFFVRKRIIDYYTGTLDPSQLLFE